jgi:hypothetical protein
MQRLICNLIVFQVETFGAMAKTEKIAFILEQVKYMLCLFSRTLEQDPVITLTRLLKSC